MIEEFIAVFTANKKQLEERYKEEHPTDYAQIVKDVIRLINPEKEYALPDYDRITEIDYGAEQGTLLYVIGAAGHIPSNHWYLRVWYGSRRWWDSNFEHMKEDSDGEKPNDYQVEYYMTLAAQIVERLKKMKGAEV